MTGEEFKKFRADYGLTQTELGDALGISRMTVAAQERRANERIASDVLYTLALKALAQDLKAQKAKAEADAEALEQ